MIFQFCHTIAKVVQLVNKKNMIRNEKPANPRKVSQFSKITTSQLSLGYYNLKKTDNFIKRKTKPTTSSGTNM